MDQYWGNEAFASSLEDSTCPPWVTLDGAARDHAKEQIALPSVSPAPAPRTMRSGSKQWRRALDTIPQMVWTQRPDGSGEYYNRLWQEFTGWSVGEPGAPAQIDLLHPSDRAPATATWKESLATGTPFEFQYRLRHRSGEYRWIQSRARPERSSNGEIVGWYGTCTEIHDRVLAQEELRLSETRTQTILDSIPHIIWSADADGRLDYVSEQWGAFHGPSTDISAAGKWLRAVHPDDRRAAWKGWQSSVASGQKYEAEFRIRHRSGDYVWALVQAVAVADARDGAIHWYGTCTDIHQRVLAQHALDDSERLNRGIIEASPDCVSLLDLNGTVLFVNEATVNCYGAADASALVGTRWGSSFSDNVRRQAKLALAAAQSGTIGHLTAHLQHPVSKRWWDIIIAPVRNDAGQPFRMVVVSRDITHQKETEERVRWTANHDSLTQLPNRAMLQQRLDEAIEGSAGNPANFALLLLDIDDFKLINDTVGHDAGDALLCTFADRLKAATRPDDTIARLGGDELGVILSGVSKEHELDTAVGHILQALAQPFLFDGRIFDCHASMGASLFPRQASSRTELMKNADVALYAAKANGRGSCKLFRPQMRMEMEKRTSMLSVARKALQQDRIFPYYQPKIDLETGKLSGFEALLRWKSPRRGVLGPGPISAVFEDMTLASEISESIIGQVVADMRSWLDQGLDFGHVAINAAAAEFRKGDFADRLLEKLAAASIPANHLHLEVTETVFLGRGAYYVERALKTLSAQGLQIALDDFGTGYASLSHLKQFPVDIIKIDRSFIQNLQRDSGDSAIAHAVINLGKSLGIGVVAEGIETIEQHEILTGLGCDYGQGFLYGKAVSARRVPWIIGHGLDRGEEQDKGSRFRHW